MTSQPGGEFTAAQMERALGARSELRAYVSARPGEVITPAEVAQALDMTAEDAELALRVLAVSVLDGAELTRRRGGWVYRPPEWC
jgi:hypothetical protein